MKTKFQQLKEDFNEGLQAARIVKKGVPLEALETEVIDGDDNKLNFLFAVCDELVIVNGKVPSRIPAAITTELMVEGKPRISIVANIEFTKIPDEIQKAFYSHEHGHILLGHLEELRKFFPRMKYFLFRLLGLITYQEIDADHYAQSQGHDMFRAIEWYLERDDLPDGMRKELEKRYNFLSMEKDFGDEEEIE